MSGRIVTIFGSSKPREDEVPYREAHDLGAALARTGWTICNGGYGGTMEAAAKGAKAAGGATIGVTCTLFDRPGPNAFIDEVVETCDLFVRLQHLVRLGQAYIVLPGGSGTLVEFAIVWELVAKRICPPKPIILYSRFWESVVETTCRERPRSREYIHFAESPAQVLHILSGVGIAEDRPPAATGR
jgi:uncharacterized protein (TIGR00730 family)